MTRRTFHRAAEGERRHDLIAATLDCIAEVGLKGATVREIAVRAGVTAGLVRHYFETKDQMIADAYRAVIASFMLDASSLSDDDAGARLKAFICAHLTAPVANSRNLSLWASFISQVRVDPALAEIHREGYLAFRSELESLLADFHRERGHAVDAARDRRLAIAINGLMDGLWLEGCLAGDLFADAELVTIALSSVDALLGQPLQADVTT